MNACIKRTVILILSFILLHINLNGIAADPDISEDWQTCNCLPSFIIP